MWWCPPRRAGPEGPFDATDLGELRGEVAYRMSTASKLDLLWTDDRSRMPVMPDLLDQLISNPGLYVGSDVDPTGEHDGGPSAARIRVRALPGGAGVTMDYECLSPTNGRVHDEHAVLARTAGGLVLLTAHSHAPVATILREAEPGHFPAAEGDSPFPMAIQLEVPEPGHLRYLWSYGMPGEEPQLRDVGELQLVSG